MVILINSETNYWKYVGCFDAKHLETLEPVSDFQSCESTCSETPFYGYNVVIFLISLHFGGKSRI